MSKHPHHPHPVVLIVRDGWGRNPHPEHDRFNAIKLARTPVCDELLKNHPWTLIKTSGEDVGLPDGTMGNSEVGHQNLGAGRIVDQESVRITKEIQSEIFFENEVLIEAVRRAREKGGTVHLLGIASDAGVHGRLSHLYACLELCRRLEQRRVALHLFTDGRDTGPFTGIDYVRQIHAQCQAMNVGQIASICGRYYAMDRDNRWQRIEQAYRCLTTTEETSGHFDTPWAAISDYYDQPTSPSQTGDEFITPRRVGASTKDICETRIRDGDAVIFYNYRGDRPRQITRAFVMDPFFGQVKPSPENGERGFDRGPKLDIAYVTMTAYEAELNKMVHVVFPKPPKIRDIGGAVLASNGLTQFRCAETEKFAHVTFFFNDYREEELPGESRWMAQSPKVATYDLQPEMSATTVRDQVLARIESDTCENFMLVNFANPDMVGHTGKLEAAIKAVETVDGCVGAIVDKTLARGGKLIVTADHGNCEQMHDPKTNAPHTAHTTYDVECIIVNPQIQKAATGSADQRSKALKQDSRLADVFPTVLSLLDLPQPQAMTGEPLFSCGR